MSLSLSFQTLPNQDDALRNRPRRFGQQQQQQQQCAIVPSFAAHGPSASMSLLPSGHDHQALLRVRVLPHVLARVRAPLHHGKKRNGRLLLPQGDRRHSQDVAARRGMPRRSRGWTHGRHGWHHQGVPGYRSPSDHCPKCRGPSSHKRVECAAHHALTHCRHVGAHWQRSLVPCHAAHRAHSDTNWGHEQRGAPRRGAPRLGTASFERGTVGRCAEPLHRCAHPNQERRGARLSSRSRGADSTLARRELCLRPAV